MLKSLYSGVTGMRSQQKKMDVIANNIANVSTTGFKAGRVRFQDLISEIDSPAQASNENRGGLNTQQLGMGVQVSGTDTIMTSGSLQTTGRSLDFGIQNGDNSFFILGGREDGEGEKQYTRDGGFFVDQTGTLVTSTGLRVLGYQTGTGGNLGIPTLIAGSATSLDIDGRDLHALKIHEKLVVDANDNISLFDPDNPPAYPSEVKDLQSFNIDNTGTIIGTYTDGNSYILGRVGLASFNNPDGLEKSGGNSYRPTANSGDALTGAPAEAGYGEVRSGFLEMSNVDLANEFTEMIVTNRAYQANSRAITTSDEMLQELLNLKR